MKHKRTHPWTWTYKGVLTKWTAWRTPSGMTRALFRGSACQSFLQFESLLSLSERRKRNSRLTDTPCDFDFFSVSDNRVGLWWGENTAKGVSFLLAQLIAG